MKDAEGVLFGVEIVLENLEEGGDEGGRDDGIVGGEGILEGDGIGVGGKSR